MYVDYHRGCHQGVTRAVLSEHAGRWRDMDPGEVGVGVGEGISVALEHPGTDTAFLVTFCDLYSGSAKPPPASCGLARLRAGSTRVLVVAGVSIC